MSEVCGRKGCNNEGEFYPVLNFYSHENGTPATAQLGMKLCGECMVQSRVQDFMTEQEWNKFVQLFIANGKVRPKKKLTKLTWTKQPMPGGGV
jgi:hypothetical protein